MGMKNTIPTDELIRGLRTWVIALKTGDHPDALIYDLKAAADRLEEQAKAPNPRTFGRWKEQICAGFTPGGTPLYVCGRCGGSNHLYGTEYPKRKIVCDCCGQINIYPGEEAWEEGSSLWPTEEKQE